MASIHPFRAEILVGDTFSRGFWKFNVSMHGCLTKVVNWMSFTDASSFFPSFAGLPICYTMSKSDRNCVFPGCSNRQDSSCCKWGFPSPQEIGSRTVTITLCEVSTLRFGQLWKPLPSLSIRHLFKNPKDSAKRPARSEWFFMKAVACGNPADALETLLCVSCALQEVPGGVCDYIKGDVLVIFEVFPASRRKFVSSADPWLHRTAAVIVLRAISTELVW